MTVPSTPLLAVEGLTVEFPVKSAAAGGKLRAVDDVNFILNSGETLGIVGESGCGKTTLGRAILQLIGNQSGRVLWMGQNISGLRTSGLKALRREMQVIFQDPFAALDPRLDIRSIAGMPLRTFEPELSHAAARSRVDEALRQVGLSPALGDRYPHELSGGQCQRVGIARAIILRPKLIVCDEPVSALDVSIQAQIINLLMDIQRSQGLSLLFISHNLAVVRHISHRILVLYLGKVMEIADREELFSNPLHPYTQALISAVPIADPRIERERVDAALGGELPSPLSPPPGCRLQTRCPKVQTICRDTQPELLEITRGHFAACHFARRSG